MPLVARARRGRGRGGATWQVRPHRWSLADGCAYEVWVGTAWTSAASARPARITRARTAGGPSVSGTAARRGVTLTAYAGYATSGAW